VTTLIEQGNVSAKKRSFGLGRNTVDGTVASILIQSEGVFARLQGGEGRENLCKLLRSMRAERSEMKHPSFYRELRLRSWG